MTAAAGRTSPGVELLDAIIRDARTASYHAHRVSNGMPSDPRWYQRASVYQLHVGSFADTTGNGTGDFPGITEHLDHIQSLGHDAVWILPFYPSPLRDGGYDIADYLDVNPIYGTLPEFDEFVAGAHARGIRVITELVLNHTSSHHPWFLEDVRRVGAVMRAAGGGEAGRQALCDVDPTTFRYVWDFSPHETGPPPRWRETRVIFHDFEASNWAWHDDAQAWYWHRFYTEQPDLNWDNPDVVRDMFATVDFWLDRGVDGIRLDAVPYLYERDGYDGENLPETHTAVKALRAHVDARYDSRMLLGEANMPARETLEYFGRGEGDEAHALFNFPLMPRLFMGTLFGDKQHVIDGLELTREIPSSCAWLTFLRNHDEMTLEKVTTEQRDAVWRMYREGVPEAGIDADPFGPINLGVRLRLSDLLGHDPARIEMMNALLYSQPGTPIMYYGDEIGMATNRDLPDRHGCRTPMQWDDTNNGGFSTADPASILHPPTGDSRYGVDRINVASQVGQPESMLERSRAIVRARHASDALSAGSLHVVDTADRAVVAYRRDVPEETVLVVTNLTRHPVRCALAAGELVHARMTVLHASRFDDGIHTIPDHVELEPYGYRWWRVG